MRFLHNSRLLPAAVAALVAVLVIGACSGSGDGARDATVTTIPLPGELADLPEVVLLTPAATGAAEVPVFTWEPVSGAALYRLTVLGKTGLIWAWMGTDPAVRLGGYDSEPSPGFGGVRITAGAYWSVVALNPDRAVLASSGMRPVSATDTAVAWIPGGAQPTVAPVEQPEQPVVPANGLHPLLPCDVLTPDDAETFLGGDLGPVDDDAAIDTYFRFCGYELAANANLTLSLGLTQGEKKWRPKPDHVAVDGLGEDSFVRADGWGIEVHFLRGPFAVKVTSSFGAKKLDEAIELARTIDTRIADATG